MEAFGLVFAALAMIIGIIIGYAIPVSYTHLTLPTTERV